MAPSYENAVNDANSNNYCNVDIVGNGGQPRCKKHEYSKNTNDSLYGATLFYMHT